MAIAMNFLIEWGDILGESNLPKRNKKVTSIFFFHECPVELYHCFEFLSMRLLVWGISTPQLIKSVSAGNRNTLPTIIALNKSTCPQSQWEKGECLNAVSCIASVHPYLLWRKLAVVNATCLLPSQPGCLWLPNISSAACSLPAFLFEFLKLLQWGLFFLFNLYLPDLQYSRVMVYSPFYGTSLEFALLLKPGSKKLVLHKKPSNWESKCWNPLNLFLPWCLSYFPELPVELRWRPWLEFLNDYITNCWVWYSPMTSWAECTGVLSTQGTQVFWVGLITSVFSLPTYPQSYINSWSSHPQCIWRHEVGSVGHVYSW